LKFLKKKLKNFKKETLKRMSKSTNNSPETRLKKLRRLETNMTCPNCGTQAQAGIGFGNVCVKFKTFVCDSCKFNYI
jgi:rubredoxin